MKIAKISKKRVAPPRMSPQQILQEIHTSISKQDTQNQRRRSVVSTPGETERYGSNSVDRTKTNPSTVHPQASSRVPIGSHSGPPSATNTIPLTHNQMMYGMQSPALNPYSMPTQNGWTMDQPPPGVYQQFNPARTTPVGYRPPNTIPSYAQESYPANNQPATGIDLESLKTCIDKIISENAVIQEIRSELKATRESQVVSETLCRENSENSAQTLHAIKEVQEKTTSNSFPMPLALASSSEHKKGIRKLSERVRAAQILSCTSDTAGCEQGKENGCSAHMLCAGPYASLTDHLGCCQGAILAT